MTTRLRAAVVSRMFSTVTGSGSPPGELTTTAEGRSSTSDCGAGGLIAAVGERVGDRLAQHDLREARQLIAARAEDYQLGPEFTGDATDGFLERMVQRPVDLFAAVIVDAGVVREPQHLNARARDGSGSR